MKSLLLLLTVVVACGCPSTNATLVSQATATQTYYTAAYEHKCQGTGNPPAQCGRCKQVINDGQWKIETAKINRDIGYLPPEEIAELQALVTELQSCP